MWLWFAIGQSGAATVCAMGESEPRGCFETVDAALAAGETTLELAAGVHVVTQGALTAVHSGITIGPIDPYEYPILTLARDTALDSLLTLDGTQNVLLRRLTLDADHLGAISVAGARVRGLSLINGAQVRLEDVLIADFHTDGNGGGVAVDEGGTLVMEAVEFYSNEADQKGGQLWASEASVQASYTWFIDGDADVGGGVYATAGSQLEIRYSTFNGNSAMEGGAIALFRTPTMTLEESSFCFNNAPIGATISATEACNTGCQLFTNVLQSEISFGGSIVDMSGGLVSFTASTLIGNSSNGGASVLRFDVPALVFDSNLVVFQDSAGPAVQLVQGLPGRVLGNNGWYGNTAFDLGRGRTQSLPLPDGELDVSVEPRFVQIPGAEDLCPTAVLLAPTEGNRPIIDRQIGAYTLDQDGDGAISRLDCNDRNPLRRPGIVDEAADGLRRKL